MKRQCIATIMLIISLLIFVFLILPILNLNQFVDSLKNTDLIIFSIALLFLLLSNVTASLRWSVLLQEVNGKNSSRFFNALGIFCFGQVAGLIVPSRVGNYTKVPLVTRLDNISYESGLAAVNAETLLDMIYIACAGVVSISILSVFLYSLIPTIPFLVVLILFFVIGTIFIVFMISLFKFNLKKTIKANNNQNIIISTLASIIGKLLDLIESTRLIFTNKRSVLNMGLLTLITQLFGLAGLYFILESVHSPLPILDLFAILTLSYIVGIASLIPGGFGASDLSLIALLGFKGIPLSIATNVAILWRIAMYLPIFVLIGVFFLQQKISRQDIIV
jgi:glycosyltransferase 2 family protein